MMSIFEEDTDSIIHIDYELISIILKVCLYNDNLYK